MRNSIVMSDYSLALNTLVNKEMMIEDHVKPILENIALMEWHAQQVKSVIEAEGSNFLLVFAEYKLRYDPLVLVSAVKDVILNYISGDGFNFLGSLLIQRCFKSQYHLNYIEVFNHILSVIGRDKMRGMVLAVDNIYNMTILDCLYFMNINDKSLEILKYILDLIIGTRTEEEKFVVLDLINHRAVDHHSIRFLIRRGQNKNIQHLLESYQ